MNRAGPRLDALIERYLDGVLTEAERLELNAALAADPAAARRFAAQARFDHALYLHFHRAAAASAAREALAAALAGADAAQPAVRLTPWYGRALDHVWGPSIAVLAHAALLLLLVRFVFLPAPVRRPTMAVAVPEAEPAPMLEAIEPAPDPDAAPPVQPPLPRLRLPEPTTPPALPSRPLAALPDASLAPWPTAPTRAPLPALYAGRAPAERRAALHALADPDMADRLERAREDALERLARTQAPDGRWRDDEIGDTAATAAVLLAFFAGHHTPGTPLYGETVARGLRWLLADPGRAVAADTAIDPQAARLLALAEAQALTRIPALAEAVGEAAETLVTGQRSDGAWPADDGTPSDEAVRMAWSVHALRLAAADGLAPPSADLATAQAIAYLKTRHDAADALYLTPTAADPGEEAMRVAAVWRTLRAAGEPTSPEARRASQRLGRELRRAGSAADWPAVALHEAALALATDALAGDARAAAALEGILAAAARRVYAGPETPGESALAALALSAPYRYRRAAGLPVIVRRETAAPPAPPERVFPTRRPLSSSPLVAPALGAGGRFPVVTGSSPVFFVRR